MRTVTVSENSFLSSPWGGLEGFTARVRAYGERRAINPRRASAQCFNLH